MDLVLGLFRGNRTPEPPASDLTEDEQQRIAADLERRYSGSNRRLDEVEQSLLPLLAQAGLDGLRSKFGRRHG